MSDALQQQQLTLLAQRFLSKDLNAASFCAQFIALWAEHRDNTDIAPEGGKAAAFDALVNEVHSACYVFDPAPTLAWEIGEEQLRWDVQGAWNEYLNAIGAAVPAPNLRMTKRL